MSKRKENYSIEFKTKAVELTYLRGNVKKYLMNMVFLETGIDPWSVWILIVERYFQKSIRSEQHL